MRVKRTALAALAFLSIAALAVAETSMNMDEAVAAALGNNASLKRSALELAEAKRASDAAVNLLYPAASVSGGLDRAGTFASTFAGELDRYSLSAGVSVSFSLSPETKLRMERLALAYEAELITYEKAKRAIELQVRTSFYSILLDKAELALAEQNLERERKNCEQVKAKYEAGLVAELDYLSAQVSLAGMEPKVESAKVSLENGIDSFRLLLGLPDDAALDLTGDLGTAADLKVEAIRSEAAGSRGGNLAVAAIRKSIEIAELDKKLAELDISPPSLALAAKLTPTLSGFGSGPSLSDSTATLSATVSLPLGGYLPSSSEKLALLSAEDELVSLGSELAEAAGNSKSSVAAYLRAIAASSASLSALGRSVDLAQKTYDLTRQAYDKGLKDLSDLSTAAGEADTARADFLSAEYTLLSKVLGLEDELGVAFGSMGRN